MKIRLFQLGLYTTSISLTVIRRVIHERSYTRRYSNIRSPIKIFLILRDKILRTLRKAKEATKKSLVNLPYQITPTRAAPLKIKGVDTKRTLAFIYSPRLLSTRLYGTDLPRGSPLFDVYTLADHFGVDYFSVVLDLGRNVPTNAEIRLRLSIL